MRATTITSTDTINLGYYADTSAEPSKASSTQKRTHKAGKEALAKKKHEPEGIKEYCVLCVGLSCIGCICPCSIPAIAAVLFCSCCGEEAADGFLEECCESVCSGLCGLCLEVVCGDD